MQNFDRSRMNCDLLGTKDIKNHDFVFWKIIEEWITRSEELINRIMIMDVVPTVQTNTVEDEVCWKLTFIPTKLSSYVIRLKGSNLNKRWCRGFAHFIKNSRIFRYGDFFALFLYAVIPVQDSFYVLLHSKLPHFLQAKQLQRTTHLRGCYNFWSLKITRFWYTPCTF